MRHTDMPAKLRHTRTAPRRNCGILACAILEVRHCGTEASVIYDLMSWAAWYNSFTLSQSAISNEGCSQDTLSIAAALHL